MGGLLRLVQWRVDWAGPQLAQAPPRCTKNPLIGGLLHLPNVTVHPSTASVPITVLLHNGPFVCGFNVSIKGLTENKTL